MMFSRLFRPKTTRIELDLTDAQIVQFRGVMDRLPLDPYASLVVAVLKKLPLDHESAAGTPSGADADPQVHTTTPRGPAGGSFKLVPFTPKGAAGVAHIERALGTLEVVDERLPHGGGGSL